MPDFSRLPTLGDRPKCATPKTEIEPRAIGKAKKRREAEAA